MRKTDILTLSLPPKLSKIIEKVTKEENLTRSELIREALRFYFRERERWQQIKKWGKATAKKFKINSEEEIEKIIDEIRK